MYSLYAALITVSSGGAYFLFPSLRADSLGSGALRDGFAAVRSLSGGSFNFRTSNGCSAAFGCFRRFSLLVLGFRLLRMGAGTAAAAAALDRSSRTALRRWR